MQKSQTKTFAYVSLLILSYRIVYYAYIGIIHPIPALGDSWDYHIPISQSILSGTFLTLPHATVAQWYYPGSAEAINALFLLLHIPLTLSNLFAVLVLFVVCFVLGRTFRLHFYLSILFAAMVCGLNVFVRWYNAVSIDVWVAVFFLLGIILLEKPRKSYLYFATLGFVLGMLIGSKYTACLFAVLLVVLYWKPIISNISFGRLITFIIPFSIFGLFWYIRNAVLKQNPFYPMPVLGFAGRNIFSDTVFNQTIEHPLQMVNAVFGEYNVWTIIVLGALCFYIYRRARGKAVKIAGIGHLYAIGIINLLLYFTFPTSSQPWIMVSSLRYSFPVFIPLILASFLLAAYYKKEMILGLVAIGSMLMVLSVQFLPILTMIYIPLWLFSIFAFEKYHQWTTLNESG